MLYYLPKTAGAPRCTFLVPLLKKLFRFQNKFINPFLPFFFKNVFLFITTLLDLLYLSA
jgi:hypothetical protein